MTTGRILTNGKMEQEMPDYRQIDEGTRQQKAYVVLTEDERNKGFIRPLRHSYTHLVCGVVTRMSEAIAETYARDPKFYGATFCVGCGRHLPVGEDGEFVWANTNSKVGT